MEKGVPESTIPMTKSQDEMASGGDLQSITWIVRFIGLLPILVIVYALKCGLPDTFVGEGLSDFTFYMLHFLTPVALFLMTSWSRWVLLATITVDTLIIIMLPVTIDLLANYQPINLHAVMTETALRYDAAILIITVPLYLISVVMLIHPKLGRVLGELQQSLY